MNDAHASGFSDFLERLPLLRGVPSPVVVGCSGGADSAALLVLAVAAGHDVIAVTVDHGLRSDSASEAERVGELAHRLGVEHVVVAVNVPSGPNLEARARAERLAALTRVAETRGAARILLGHTADDRAETFVLNLMRGSGRAGLSSPREQREEFVRPLLGLRRADTIDVCARAGYEPVNDPMNEDVEFRRVWVRRELLPQLSAAADRDIVEVLNRQADVFAAEDDLLDRLAHSAWPGAEADARVLRDLDVALARRAVRGWVGAPPPTFAEVERVLAVARGQARAAELRGDVRVTRSRNRMILEAGRPVRAGTGSAPVPNVLPVDGAEFIGRTIVSEDELQSRINELGKQITVDYADDPPLLVGVLKGAYMFMADLARAIDLPVEFDFMAVSSYGSATRTSGVVRIIKDLDADLSGRHVILVEDIVDSGLTLAYLRKNLMARGPASLEVCALLLKEGLQRTEPDLRYVGFSIPPEFVIGYGLDVDEKYRNLPFIAEYIGPEAG
ncbi:MAG: hypoxanthine phosphoribosyltransferase [Acidimicrobiia bacterium]